MAIVSQIARFILKEHKHRSITGDLLLIGRQEVMFSLEKAVQLLDAEGIEIRDGHGVETVTNSGSRNSPLSNVSFFGLFSEANVQALDVSDYEGAEILHDMNLPIPDSLEQKFDFILDGGCLDNIFAPNETIKNIAKLLRPGGRVVHSNYMSYVPTVYTAMSLDWYFDYYGIRGLSLTVRYPEILMTGERRHGKNIT